MNEHPSPENPIERFAILIFYLNGLLMQNGDRLTKDIGQTSARWHVLGQVEFQSQTVAEIARNMGRARQSVQRVSDALAKDGLVVYSNHPSDKRTQLVVLTERGKEVIAHINQQNAKWVAAMMQQLEPSQVTQVNTSLAEIAEAFITVTKMSERVEI